MDVAAVVTRRGIGGRWVEDVETGGVAAWKVPWSLAREIVVDVQYPGREAWDAGVWTHETDARSQVWVVKGAR